LEWMKFRDCLHKACVLCDELWHSFGWDEAQKGFLQKGQGEEEVAGFMVEEEKILEWFSKIFELLTGTNLAIRLL